MSNAAAILPASCTICPVRGGAHVVRTADGAYLGQIHNLMGRTYFDDALLGNEITFANGGPDVTTYLAARAIADDAALKAIGDEHIEVCAKARVAPTSAQHRELVEDARDLMNDARSLMGFERMPVA